MADPPPTLRARRTIIVGAHGEPPHRRISIDVLEIIVRKLRESVSAVAADLGIPESDVSQVDLVDLVDGCGGAVFEQSVRAIAAAQWVPLAVAVDAARSYAHDKTVSPILTQSSAAIVADMVEAYAEIAAAGTPVFLADDSTWHVGENPIEVGHAVEVLATLALQRPKDEPETAKAEAEKKEVDLPIVGEWLVVFTGTMRRLDKKDRGLWIETKDGLAYASRIGDALFRAADADKLRWKRVTVLCIASGPNTKSIKEVLHVTPADAGSIEFNATPLNEAARGLGAVMDKIESFANLEESWDSYAGRRINAKARKAASNFLLLAATALRTSSLKLITPFAAPLPNGSVQLEWERGHACLDLEFRDDGSIVFLRGYGEDYVEGDASREFALELVSWFHAKALS